MTTPYVFRTLLAAAQDIALAQQIAATLGPGGSQGMFQTPLGPTAAGPVTWGASSGWIDPAWAQLAPCTTWAQDPETGAWTVVSTYPGDPVAVVAACGEAGLALTVPQVTAIFARADVSEQDPETVFGRLGVTIVQPDDPG